MDILLDTHTVLWFFEGSGKLSKFAIEKIYDTANKKYISIATIWEVAVKKSIGKLKLDGGIEEFLGFIEDNGFILLEIKPDHIIAITDLPFIHRDPFDRMLVAQATVDDMSVMTVDKNIMKYGVDIV